MIRFRLQCKKGHTFESWFSTGEQYDRLCEAGQVTCPACGSTKVEKALMTPQLAKKSNSRTVAPGPDTGESTPTLGGELSKAQEHYLKALRTIRDHVTENSDFVGEEFAREARKIHYGDAEKRSIYGKATPKETTDLKQEGIEFHPLPTLPEDKN